MVATKKVPPGGLPSWPEPDPSGTSGPDLPGGLDVEVLADQENGWAQVRCSNGWEAWVDGRRLVAPASPALPPARRPPARLIIGGAAVAAVVLVTYLLAQGNGNPAPSTTGSVVSASSAPAGLFDDAALTQALAEVAATPADKLRAEPSDDAAVAAVTESMKAAGFDLGPAVYVMALSAETNLLYVLLDESSPLLGVPEDQAKAFLTALATSPVMAQQRISRLAVDFDSKDDKGPLTVSFTARMSDLAQAQVGGNAIGDRAAFQLVRP